MQVNEFENLVKHLSQQQTLPDALSLLKKCEDEEVSQVAQSLSGQFMLAQTDDINRIYHVTEQLNDEGEMQEYIEHIMNEEDDVILFVAWFFDTFFDMKPKDIYKLAGKTYSQPKRIK